MQVVVNEASSDNPSVQVRMCMVDVNILCRWSLIYNVRELLVLTLPVPVKQKETVEA